MIRRPPRSTLDRSSAASDVYKRQIVGIVGTYKGYTATNGTEGVGKAATTAVVVSSLMILIFDMVLVKVTLWLWPTV